MAELGRGKAAGGDWNIFAGSCLYIPIQFRESSRTGPVRIADPAPSANHFLPANRKIERRGPTFRSRPRRPPQDTTALILSGSSRSLPAQIPVAKPAKLGGRIWRQDLRPMDQNFCREPAARECGRQGKRRGRQRPPRPRGNIAVVPTNMSSAVHRPLGVGASAQHAFDGGKHGPRGTAAWCRGARNDTPDDWGWIEVHGCCSHVGAASGTGSIGTRRQCLAKVRER